MFMFIFIRRLMGLARALCGRADADARGRVRARLPVTLCQCKERRGSWPTMTPMW
jgi:hypothetical protein